MSVSFPEPAPVNGEKLRFGVVAARYNQDLVDHLLEKVTAALTEAGVPEEGISVLRVPGSNEIPYGIQFHAETGSVDCCIALGVLIKGATAHYHLVGQSVSDALQMVALNTGIPAINGVVVADSRVQAEERIRGNLDRGAEFANAALEMAALKRSGEDSSDE